MTEAVGQFFSSITHNDYLTLFLVSIIPLIELRGGLIIAASMNVNTVAAMFTCIAGSSAVIIPLILFIKPIIKKLKSTKLFYKLGLFVEDILLDKAEKVKKSAQKGIAKNANAEIKKFVGLLSFVAIPLPLTGSWTGSGIGAALDMKLWKAALSIFIGNVIAAGILTVLMLFVPTNMIDVILYSFLAFALFAVLLTITVAVIKKKRSKNSCKAVVNSEQKENFCKAVGNEKNENTCNTVENGDKIDDNKEKQNYEHSVRAIDETGKDGNIQSICLDDKINRK